MILPRNDLVLIERLEVPPVGNIIVPDIAKEKSILGRVLAVGPGKLIEGINGGWVRKTPEVNIGDIVYFNSKWSEFAGSHFAEDQIAFDDRLHLVFEADIFLKVGHGRNAS